MGPRATQPCIARPATSTRRSFSPGGLHAAMRAAAPPDLAGSLTVLLLQPSIWAAHATVGGCCASTMMPRLWASRMGTSSHLGSTRSRAMRQMRCWLCVAKCVIPTSLPGIGWSVLHGHIVALEQHTQQDHAAVAMRAISCEVRDPPPVCQAWSGSCLHRHLVALSNTRSRTIVAVEMRAMSCEVRDPHQIARHGVVCAARA